MYNPITYIKDVIELVRKPPGQALAAGEITDANIELLRESGVPEKYLRIGDFCLEFENNTTIVPRKEFFKHYEFTQEPDPDPTNLTPVRTIKPL